MLPERAICCKKWYKKRDGISVKDEGFMVEEADDVEINEDKLKLEATQIV